MSLMTGGNVIISVFVGTMIVAPRERRRVGILLAIGAGSHLITDGLLQSPSGRSYAMFWPLIRWHSPIPGLYLSTQVEPMLATGVLTAICWLWSRNQSTDEL